MPVPRVMLTMSMRCAVRGPQQPFHVVDIAERQAQSRSPAALPATLGVSFSMPASLMAFPQPAWNHSPIRMMSETRHCRDHGFSSPPQFQIL
jgi:hypothetical protein